MRVLCGPSEPRRRAKRSSHPRYFNKLNPSSAPQFVAVLYRSRALPRSWKHNPKPHAQVIRRAHKPGACLRAKEFHFFWDRTQGRPGSIP